MAPVISAPQRKGLCWRLAEGLDISDTSRFGSVFLLLSPLCDIGMPLLMSATSMRGELNKLLSISNQF